MFTMMNNARLNVGMQGVQIGRARDPAGGRPMRASASSRRAPAGRRAIPVAIIEHPDVRRMLLRMKALTQGARALIYYAAGQVDRAHLGDARPRRRGSTC